MNKKEVKVAEQNDILTQTKLLAELFTGKQREYYLQQLRDFHHVHCVSIKDVFTDDEIELIRRVVKPQPKKCFKNAHLLTALFPDRVQYTEGQVTIFNGSFGIEHAWNKVDGVYVDITFEMALNEDPTTELYMALGTYNFATLTQVTSETGYYGSIYNYRISKILNNKKIKTKAYENYCKSNGHYT